MRFLSMALLGVSLLTLAGCFAPDSTPFYYEAGGPVVMPPEMNYTGGVFQGKGHARLWVDPEHQSARLEMNVSTDNGFQLTTTWTHFEAQQAWQALGLAANVRENGASGHDSPILPEVTATYAGWGCANFTFHGRTLVDLRSGVQCLSSRFTVTEQGVLQPGTHFVTKRDGTPFDPRNPSDGKTYPGKRELHVEVSGPGAKDTNYRAYDAPQVQTFGDTATGTPYSRTFPFRLTGYLNQMHVTATADVGGVGTLTVTVRDEAGRDLGSSTLTLLGRGGGAIIPPPRGLLPGGNYTVTVNGTAANAAYTLHVSDTVPFPTHFYVIFTQVQPPQRRPLP